ncbi:hypothetical protein [Thalassotalea sp. PS06]|uniref:hypothetical protein n=1 Tax=Thalassotalea sp. PS06 TaxID=2594005 RepID=UPI0011629529|nr:hypothetical protein [Thalassotalea sp. PS06]QDO99899.1 hypothetical protein FNC98_00150 [Thalassotalea sp. PS06]
MNQSLLFNDDFEVLVDQSLVRFSGMASGRKVVIVVNFKPNALPKPGAISQELKFDLEALVEEWTEDNDLDDVTEISLSY